MEMREKLARFDDGDGGGDADVASWPRWLAVELRVVVEVVAVQ